jgi:hypothetical protein
MKIADVGLFGPTLRTLGLVCASSGHALANVISTSPNNMRS